MNTRTKLSMVSAEFFGTAILASLMLAQVNAVGAILSSPWFVAVTAGLTLTVLSLAATRISGAHFNPAITLGLWSLRRLPTTTTVVFIASQMLGGAVALVLFQYLSNTTIANVAGSFDWRVFVAEMVGTFVFAHGVAAAALQNFTAWRAAFTVGASYMLGIILATTASNGALNPAVALSFNSWSWTYVLAPVAGAFLGMNVYNIFFGHLDRQPVVIERSARSTTRTKTTVITAKKKRR